MGKVTEFLLRWLFLANMIDDRIDIQNIPPPMQIASNQNPYNQNNPYEYSSPPVSEASYNTASSSTLSTSSADDEWKIKCRQGIAMYPPGTPRRLALDSLRVEIVHSLASQLKRADEVLKRNIYKTLHRNHDIGSHEEYIERSTESKNNKKENSETSTTKAEILFDLADPKSPNSMANKTSLTSRSTSLKDRHLEHDDDDDEEQALDDSLLDADLEIIEALRQATYAKDPHKQSMDSNNAQYSYPTSTSTSTSASTSASLLTKEEEQKEIEEAQTLLMEAREYLPQLVSAVLHSRQALTPQPSLDPIQAMRKLLITRCLEDPGYGIELCWLLEAEVGRAWKSLFEHRQQTGRRLIVVLPAEKARVIAKIGTEKRSAFDLLQDAEQATAYGCTRNSNHHSQQHSMSEYAYGHHDPDFPAPLPAALSLKRCSHFGDTMHFIDSLTQISLDLRMLPTLERNAHLVNRLDEINRRLRRRMVTKGAVSLDVEDSLTIEDWPHLSDVTLDMLRFSVHFPLEPKSVIWEGGDDHPSHVNETSMKTSSKENKETKVKTGIMRVLNIVASEGRILASRERCPFLVQIEVAETGLEGSDARLYAGGGVDAGMSTSSAHHHLSPQTEAGFGVSLEEVIRLFAASKQKKDQKEFSHDSPYEFGGQSPQNDFASFQIPTELLSRDVDLFSKDNNDDDNTENDAKSSASMTAATSTTSVTEIDEPNSAPSPDMDLPRGGSSYYDSEHGYGLPGGYYENYHNEMLRQQEMQRLHEQMLSDRLHQQSQGGNMQHYPQSQGSFEVPQQKTKEDLLDDIFGISWVKKCEQVRQSSPYGKVKGWRLASFIMKAGEDIRREALVMQVISKLRNWFNEDLPMNRRPYLRPYTIMCVGGDAGMLECLPDAKSVDEIKKRIEGFTTLRDYFERAYGPPVQRRPPMQPPTSNQFTKYTGPGAPPPQLSQRNSHYSQTQTSTPYTSHPQSPPPPPPQSSVPQPQHDGITFEQAQDNFIRSLVGYSLVCYILQIKDRHNANILMDRAGHLLHIDFGFVLGDTPKMGKVPLFSERAPFKLTTEFWEVIGGWKGHGVRFCKMFEAAFECASSHAEEIASLVEAAVLNLTSNPVRARAQADGIRARLRMRGSRDSAEQKLFVMDLVNSALTSWGTSTYDWLQKSMNGYQ